ncbi:YidE/YbjL duplication [Clostridiaceae bacterium M8S5]|nr:YidE/YbjL duplication [Clostridiaceae bacterium M8S5]
MKQLVQNPLLMIAVCIVLGQIIGTIRIRHIKLGNSAILFLGLLISYLLTKYLKVDISIEKTVFELSLIGFISSVGLIASKNLAKILKQYGIKFLILAFIITFTGAATTLIFISLFYSQKASIVGTYIGALTSSPGLATALEIAKGMYTDQSANVGLGYSIAYIPGVLLVILFTQLVGKKNKATVSEEIVEVSDEIQKPFDLVSFIVVIIVGTLLSLIEIKLTKTTTLSLGMTGGVLISALVLGSLRKIGKLSFDFNVTHLSIIRDISLNMFLAIVGLNYGYEAINALSQYGITLLVIGSSIGIISIGTGYLVGKYILKIETIYLIGGICGGMTSTPGLATAIDTFESEEVVVGYGATYPFALMFMIVFTNLLFGGS